MVITVIKCQTVAFPIFFVDTTSSSLLGRRSLTPLYATFKTNLIGPALSNWNILKNNFLSHSIYPFFELEFVLNSQRPRLLRTQ